MVKVEQMGYIAVLVRMLRIELTGKVTISRNSNE